MGWLDHVCHLGTLNLCMASPQSLFPIVQGVYTLSCVVKLPIGGRVRKHGNAVIGGLSVGETAEQMYEMIEVVNEILPLISLIPRGVGTPANILEGIERCRHVRLHHAHAEWTQWSALHVGRG